ncbi:TetR/AcrR family transcriptional regulator [Desulfovibrio sp. UCD-KL4C]|uniref:TetR/AcrR family transcriptional regulator n=1 Tax=Desulfovibrio sp. UCD-KL4C TaxID=2578120 RepID=UPI0025C028D4|nr:TetR/AcrR family transcriptional regulator [Desulfovibrio sp. UCD-KL4C]
MPKIVDHEKYRKELTDKAVKIFREYGYSGLGMRKIAQELGISKSALYHYFPSKEALFAECTKAVTSFDDETFDDVALKEISQQERVNALILIVKGIEKEFKGELSLLVDYLRPLTPAQVSADKNMQLANRKYLDMVAVFVGHENSQIVLCLMFGVLLQRLFDGGEYSFKEVEERLIHFIK